MLKIRMYSFLTLAAVAALMVTPIVDAQVCDLYTTVEDAIDPAQPADRVGYTVVYGNIGPDNAVAPILNLNLPPNQPADLQAYIDGDPDAIYLIDDILGPSVTVTYGEVGLFFSSACEGFLIQVNIDADNSGFGAGDSGKLKYILPMPEMQPVNPTVSVEGVSESMNFGRGACDDCFNMAGTCFGPRMSSTPAITAQIELVNDGTGEITDGCEPFIGFTPGNIAWIDRGSCNFDLKANNAQQAGASAMVIGQNVGDDRLGPDGILLMNCTDFCGAITIPVAFVSQNNNIATQAALAAGEVMGTIGAVESDTLITWASMWENTATVTDIDPSNDDWFELTTIQFFLFNDGFESGDTSAWSGSY